MNYTTQYIKKSYQVANDPLALLAKTEALNLYVPKFESHLRQLYCNDVILMMCFNHFHYHIYFISHFFFSFLILPPFIYIYNTIPTSH